jgi:uncharacterized protein (TIGR03790 family)
MLDFISIRRVLVAFVLLAFTQAGVALALDASEIALIVNSNEPAGKELAQYYAQARHIPDNRILELSLPTSEEMPFEEYEETVVPQVRDFLTSGHLEQQVKCFVTFYGVPIRIAARVATLEQSREQAWSRQELLKTAPHITTSVQAIEKMASQLNPEFAPKAGGTFDDLKQRADVAIREIFEQIRTVSDARRRAEIVDGLYTEMQPLTGQTAWINRMAIEAALKATAETSSTDPTTKATTQPVDTAQLQSVKDDFQKALKTASDLEQRRYDPHARNDLRILVFKHFGAFAYVHVLQDQVDYLESKDTGAAFDNELALVHWTAYSRTRWRDNPFYYANKKQHVPVTYMVMRLDAPHPEKVKDIITQSIQAETDGLKGKAVIDSRGIQLGQEKETEAGFSTYDQSLRDLADTISKHTKLEVMADDKPEVLHANSADDVALYCGWYSLRNYIPECKFNRGAVGFHIASYEMISLHNPGEAGWVAGLLNDGVAATLGPVQEPFLQAFPKPDEFFELILTGKLTLAEVYWKTTRMTSWMMDAIGDPLYTPYKNNPALAVEDLPQPLRVIFAPAGN